jgi:CubicO group peptidase (beta-lactamase class C family)
MFHRYFLQFNSMQIKKLGLSLLAVLLIQATVRSQACLLIDSLIEQQIANQQISGGVAYIYHQNKVIVKKAYGWADPRRTISMKENSIFRIASNTKVIVSIGVLQLVEKGLVGLDDAIEKYIPAFASQQVIQAMGDTFNLVQRKRSITIRDLLSHQSGIASADEYPKQRALYARYGLSNSLSPKFTTLAEEVEQIAAMPLMHQPGERFSYGLSTNVLGRLIELVSGLSLDKYLKKNIFRPLGMKDTYFYLPESKSARLVKMSFRNAENQLEEFSTPIFNIDYPLLDNSKYYSAIGGLVSTVTDLGTFLLCLLQEGAYSGKRIIGKEILEQFWTNQLGNKTFIFGGIPSSNNFGLGVGLTTKAGQKMNGASEGSFFWGGAFNTAYMVDRNRKLITIFFFQRTPFVLPWFLSQLERTAIQCVDQM